MILVFKKLNVSGMAVWPFIILANEKYKQNKFLINHELIHHKQQLELLIFPFYFLYLFNYLANLIKYKNHNEAYLNIIFEKEAYTNERDLNYLKTRKNFNWWEYLKK